MGGGISILSLAVVIGLRYANNRNIEMLRLDAMLCAVMAVTFPWFVYFGERVKRLVVRLDRGQPAARRHRGNRLARPTLPVSTTAVPSMSHWTRRSSAPTHRRAVLDRRDGSRPLQAVQRQLGHRAGDAVLRAFAQTVHDTCAATDLFGRYGGEEFILVLRHRSAGACEAERMRQTHELRLPFRAELPLTVSIGVAEYQPGETINRRCARRRALQAKGGGRNRVLS